MLKGLWPGRLVAHENQNGDVAALSKEAKRDVASYCIQCAPFPSHGGP